MSEPTFDSWKLALVYPRMPETVRVLAAYYATPKRRRDDLELIARRAQLEVSLLLEVIDRLQLAGVLVVGADQPPKMGIQLIYAALNEVMPKPKERPKQAPAEPVAPAAKST